MTSFSIDMDPILSNAATIFNSLFPIAGIGLGFSLAFGLIGLVLRVFKGAVSGF